MTLLPAKTPTLSWSTIAITIGVVLTSAYVWMFYTTPIGALGLHPRTREPMDRLSFHLWQVFHLPELVQQWFGSGRLLSATLERIPVLLVAAGILATAFAIGRGLLRWLGILDSLDRLERIVFGTGLGLNTLSLLTLMVGLAGWLRSPLGLTAIVISSGLLFLLNRSRSAVSVHQPATTKPQQLELFDRLLVATIGAFCILILLGSLLPPWHFDVKAYHLQAPKEWFMDGRIGFVPHNVYANMPLGSEMHALLGMMLWRGREAWWWGAMVGKVVIAAFAPLTACALYSFGRRFLTPRMGLVAALLFVSCPWVAFLSFSGLIECVIGFYLILGAYAFAIHAKSSLLTEARPDGLRRNAKASSGRAQALWCCSKADERPISTDALIATSKPTSCSLLIVSGLCAGSAAACKYPAIVFVVIPLVCAAMAWRPLYNLRQDSLSIVFRQLDVRAAALVVVAVVIACGPWYLKNLCLTGNPTYPMLYSAFGGAGWDQDKDKRWQQAHAPPADQSDRRFTIKQLKQSAEVLGWASAGHSPLLLPLAAVGLFASGYRRWVVPLVLFSIYFVGCWWCLTHHFDRFLTPLLPAGAIIGAVGWAAIDRSRSRRYAIAALLAGVVCNGLLGTSSVLGDNRFFVPLEEVRMSRVHPVHQFINYQLGDNDRVLLVGDATPYNLSVPHLYNSCFDDCQFTRMMQGKTKSQRYAALREAGVTYVFINWLDIAAYHRKGDYGYSSYVARQRIYKELVEDDKLLVPVDTGMPPSMAELFQVAALD